jgi:hypothetical protein
MFILLLSSFVPLPLLGTISTPHPPCKQWLAAADVGARVVLLLWCWGHPLVVLGCWHCPFIVIIIAASCLLPVLSGGDMAVRKVRGASIVSLVIVKE